MGSKEVCRYRSICTPRICHASVSQCQEVIKHLFLSAHCAPHRDTFRNQRTGYINRTRSFPFATGVPKARGYCRWRLRVRDTDKVRLQNYTRVGSENLMANSYSRSIDNGRAFWKLIRWLGTVLRSFNRALRSRSHRPPRRR